MRSPLVWWGGKSLLAKEIVPLLPPHKCYIEPFCGAASVFFAKPPAQINILNDTNEFLTIFYRVVRTPALNAHLIKKLNATAYSFAELEWAGDILNGKHMGACSVEKAWAIFVASHLSMLSIGRTFKLSFRRNGASQFRGKIQRLISSKAIDLLSSAQLTNGDALRLIKSGGEKADTLFYLDPPYINTEQGSYDGYTAEDFERLLDMLAGVRAKFLLSNFPSDILQRHIEKNEWSSVEIVRKKDASALGGKSLLLKTEVLVANFPICRRSQRIFECTADEEVMELAFEGIKE